MAALWRRGPEKRFGVKDLDLQDLGSVGELVAAIATIATLFSIA